MKEYFIDCLLTKDDEIIEGKITKDGLLLKFNFNNISHILKVYDKDNEGWFFNSSHDRYIAEEEFQSITANPQLAWSNGYEIIT